MRVPADIPHNRELRKQGALFRSARRRWSRSNVSDGGGAASSIVSGLLSRRNKAISPKVNRQTAQPLARDT